jgi:hypothetical protein
LGRAGVFLFTENERNFPFQCGSQLRRASWYGK